MLFLLLQLLFADTTTITLQNGVNGYAGCVDAGINDASVVDVTNYSIYVSYCIS
jgi:hypothetical protein